MSFQQILLEAGFSADEASKLSASEVFAARHANKSAYEIAHKIAEIAADYKTTDDVIRKAILTFLQFADLDHTRVLNGIKDAYKCTDEQAVKAVLTFPQFAGLDHTRVLNGIKDAYKCTDEQAVKAVLSHPPFASYDHKRVLRQQTRIGNLVNVTKEQVRNEILNRPRLASLSVKRYLAVIDVFRQLDEVLEGVSRGRMVDWWLKNFTKSPYVPGTKRERISQAARNGNTAEPALMLALRKSTHKLKIAA